MFFHYDEKQRKQRVILRSFTIFAAAKNRLTKRDTTNSKWGQTIYKGFACGANLPPIFDVNITNSAPIVVLSMHRFCLAIYV